MPRTIGNGEKLHLAIPGQRISGVTVLGLGFGATTKIGKAFPEGKWAGEFRVHYGGILDALLSSH